MEEKGRPIFQYFLLSSRLGRSLPSDEPRQWARESSDAEISLLGPRARLIRTHDIDPGDKMRNQNTLPAAPPAQPPVTRDEQL